MGGPRVLEAASSQTQRAGEEREIGVVTALVP